MECIGDNERDTIDFVGTLQIKYDIKSLGEAEKFLGMRVTYGDRGIKLDLETKTNDMLARFNMAGAHPVDTPAKESLDDELYECEMKRRDGREKSVDFPVREAVKSLLYLGTILRPDICNAIRVLSRYLENPTNAVLMGIKRVMRYLCGLRMRGLNTFMDIIQMSKDTVMLPTQGISIGGRVLVVYCDGEWFTGRMEITTTKCGSTINYGIRVHSFSYIN
jgi:hypothetical protein